MRIGVLTSGGDAPGMNAAIRAVVLESERLGLETMAIYRGYDGLISGDIKPITPEEVRHIIGVGGTILKSARSQKFVEPKGFNRAMEEIEKAKLDAIVVIGGNGSLQGASRLAAAGVPVVGIPGTIDNDIMGTDITIGFDTAVNVVVETVDRINDTANSVVTDQPRIFLIEVMGRNLGAIAVHVGLATGANWTLIPEVPYNLEDMYREAHETKYSLVIVAEGAGGALKIAQEFYHKFNVQPKVSILGHLQRGGVPTAADRILGTRLGCAAVDLLANGGSGKYVGVVDNKLEYLDFPDSKAQKTIDLDLYWLNAAFNAGKEVAI